jgi:hypothetical protein
MPATVAHSRLLRALLRHCMNDGAPPLAVDVVISLSLS